MTRSEFKAHRIGLGLSQTELAAWLDVHLMTVSKWERGINPVPQEVEEALTSIASGHRPRQRLGRRKRNADRVRFGEPGQTQATSGSTNGGVIPSQVAYSPAEIGTAGPAPPRR